MIIVVSASDSGESREGYYLGNDRPGEDIPQPPTLTDKDNPYVNITRGDDYPMDGASYLTGITLIITVSAGAGIAAGVFFVLLWPTGKILVGTLGGFSLAMILLSTRTDGLIYDQIWRWIFIGFFSISMSILAGLQKIYPYIAIISTVSSGCYGLMLGVDVFARTGLLASFKTFWGFTQPDDYRYVVDTHVIIILLSIGVLGGLFGIAIQLLELWIRQKNDRSKVEVDDDKESQDSIKLKSFRKKLTEKVHNPFKRN
ncbi:8462_t:CDS:2 [Gigaspora margarita]|uniref:8462_t:CDS:1 n=1 Tax=Gigaspora margarita TaxID=4874 RepID=A0ABN7VUK7_GIGMA|nr:8462_t:CDS:2 [Gigaspora margarita]